MADATRLASGASVPSDRPLVLPWLAAATVRGAGRAAWPAPTKTARAVVLPWRHAGSTLATVARIAHAESRGADIKAVLPWGVFAALRPVVVQALWIAARISDRRARLPWGIGRTLGVDTRAPFPAGRPADLLARLPWLFYSRPLPVGWGIPSPAGEDPGAGGGIVPVQRSYVVANAVTLVRVSDLAVIPAYSLQISADSDSWTVGWSATVKGSALSLIEPPGPGAPIELEAAINGDTWRLLVEQISRDRQFPRDRLQLSGRGISAQLAAPYAAEITRTNAGALTAAQLMDDALTINAVPIGWTVDFGLTDWLVPAGAWNHTGTHIEAVQAIAAAAGGYIRSHRTAQTLYIRPRWPVLPWALSGATPDITLPDAAVARDSLRWIERPDYNGVYVSGEAQGILAHVRVTGTQGDILAPLVTDQLITHDDAARQRGPVEIGIPGRSAMLTLDLQVLPATGVIEVGAILTFQDGGTDRTGIVRSVAVSYSHPVLRQSVEVECHA